MSKFRIWTEQIPVGSMVGVGLFPVVGGVAQATVDADEATKGAQNVFTVDKMTQSKATLKATDEQVDKIIDLLGITYKIQINGEWFFIDNCKLTLDVKPVNVEEWEGAPIPSKSYTPKQKKFNIW